MDSKEFLHLLRRNWLFCLFTSLVAGGLCFGYQMATIRPRYEASAELFFKGISQGSSQGWRYEPVKGKARATLMTSAPILGRTCQRLLQQGYSLSEEELERALTVTMSETSNTARIAVSLPDPQQAVVVREEYIGACTEFEISETMYRLRERIEELKFSEGRLRAERDEKEKGRREAVLAIGRKHGIVDVDIQSKVMERLLGRIEDDLLETTANLNRIDSLTALLQRARMQAALASLPPLPFLGLRFPPAKFQGNPNLLAQVEELEASVQQALAVRAEHHPEVAKLLKRLEALKSRVKQSESSYPRERLGGLQDERRLAQERLGVLRELVMQKHDQLRVLHDSREELNGWLKAIQRLEARLDEIDAERRSAERQESADQRTLEKAILVTNRSKGARRLPVSQMGIGLIVVIGLAIGVGATFLRQALSTGIYTSNDVQAHLNLPTLGMIPMLPSREEVRLSKGAIKSGLSELYAKVAIPLVSLASERGAKTILLTSCKDQEGKSTTSLNIAVSFAQAGYRTVLVDGDLRRSVLHKLLEIDRTPGFTAVLAGELEAQRTIAEELERRGESVPEAPRRLEDCLQETSVPNLRLLAAGSSPMNPIQLLSSSHTAEALGRLRELADFVIVDSPPILSVVDAGILAAHCDLSIIVVAQGSTTKSDALLMKRALRHAAQKIAGVIINKTKQGSERGYYYYYYSEYGTPNRR